MAVTYEIVDKQVEGKKFTRKVVLVRPLTIKENADRVIAALTSSTNVRVFSLVKFFENRRGRQSFTILVKTKLEKWVLRRHILNSLKQSEKYECTLSWKDDDSEVVYCTVCLK
jgi:hypothetical protein